MLVNVLKGSNTVIKDVTGTTLTPGNFGKDCLGDGRHFNKKGKKIECCCDECGYLMCCTEEDYEKACEAVLILNAQDAKTKLPPFLDLFAIY